MQIPLEQERNRLVNLLHGALASGGLGRSSLLGGLLLGGLSLLINVQTKRHELVNALSEAGRLLDGEAGNKEGGLEEQLGDGLDSAVVFTVGLNLLLQLLDDRGLGRDLEGLLGGHVRAHGGVTQSLSLHDTLHVGGPTELASTDSARRADELVRHDDLLNLVAKDVLEALSQVLILLLLLLALSLLLLGLLELEVLGNVDQLLAIELLQLSESVLIDGVNQEQDLKVLLLEAVKEGRLGNSLDRLASDVVDLLLVLRHAGDVVGEGGGLVTRLGRLVAEQLGKSLAVLGIFVDTELDVLAESRVELVELLTILSNLVEELKRLLDNVLLDDLHDLVLLQSLTRQVERQILRVDNTLDEAQPLGDEVGGVISDEDTTDVELDVVLGLLGLEEIERSTLGNVEDSTELKLTLDGEVLDSEMVLPVVGEGLVEGGILLLGDVGRVASPDGLGLVELLLLDLALLDSLGLLLLLLLLLLLVDLLDLGLLLLILFLLGLLSLLVRDLLLSLLQDVEVDGVGDELGVLANNLLDTTLVQVVGLLILQVQNDLGTTAELLTLGILGEGEGATSGRLPDVLLIIIVLGHNGDAVGNKISAPAERASMNCLVPERAMVPRLLIKSYVDILGHTNTGITNGEGLVLLVGDDVDAEVLARVELGRIRQGLVADLVEGIGGVRDEFSQENLLVGVDSVDDQREKLRDLSLEFKGFRRHDGGGRARYEKYGF
ncbi:hypothetical protein GB937_009016 [Aspergillus fischeri]|nr:hypothetical protein GB937_009016 [Aspergillus fischeri]